MPQLDTYYLTFRAGLHVGRHGIGQEKVLAHVPADTLFAALAVVRAQVMPDVDTWAAGFNSDAPFCLTSAFPYAGKVRFYPRPVRSPVSADPKRWRKIRFVSEGVLKRLLDGNAPETLWPRPLDKEPADGLAMQGGAIWLMRDEMQDLPEDMRTKNEGNGKRDLPPKAIQHKRVWAEATVPRVTVDRITHASEIYHTGRITYAPECGLWFGVQWRDPSRRDDFETLLRVLGDAGLGAERSAGYGAFTFERREPLTLADPPENGLMMLLSRYYPRDAQDAQALTRGDAAYELIHLAGRVRTAGLADQRRRGVRLVAEGSLIGAAAQGGLADVRPEVGEFPHAVYRYGLALGVAWKGG